MVLSWGMLVFLCAAAAAAWFWHSSLAAREQANRAAMEACERLGLQFLDGTVAFARLAFGRGSDGRLNLRRTYVFDYTANSIERRQGFVVLFGARVESTGFAPDVEPAAPAQRVETPPRADTTAVTGSHNVLDLAEWRRRHRQPSQEKRKMPNDQGSSDQGW